MLLDEDWFFGTWTSTVEIFMNAVRTPAVVASYDVSAEEVSLAGLDSLVSLLKTASPTNLAAIRKADDDLASMKSKKVREMLWRSAWKAVENVAAYDDNYFDEFPLKFVSMLSDYYVSETANGVDSLFSSEEGSYFLKSFLETLVLIIRPRKRIKQMAKSSELQLSRSSISLLKKIVPLNVSAFLFLVSTLAEIAFSVGNSVIQCPFRKNDILLEPINPSLRFEIGKYLCAIINFDAGTDSAMTDANVVAVQAPVLYTSDDSNDLMKLACLDIVARRFILDVCQSALRSRNSSFFSEASSELGRPTLQRQNSLEMFGGILSAVGSMLKIPSSSLEDAESLDLDIVGKPLHQFKAFSPPSSSEIENWTVFYATSLDIDILLFTMKAVLPSYASSGHCIFKPIVWSSLLLCTMCLGSPWSTTELSSVPSRIVSLDEAGKVNDQLKEVFSLLTTFIVQQMLPPSATSALVEVLCTISRSILTNLERLHVESAFRLQMGTLSACFDSLTETSQQSSISVDIRRCSIGGALRIVENLVDIIFRQQNQSPFSEDMHRVCERFLLKLCDLTCTLDVIPLEDQWNCSWKSCCAAVAALSSEEWSPHTLRRSSFKVNDGFSLVFNNHVFLLYPVAIRILKSETKEGFVDPGLRRAASFLLESIDPVALISSLKSLEARLRKLDAEKDIQRELGYMQV